VFEFLEAAQIELDEAFNWYEAQQLNLGVQFLTEFDAAIRRIVAYPKSYALLGSDIRRCLIKRFPGVLSGIFTSIILIFTKLKSLTEILVCFFDEDELVDLYYRNCDRGNMPYSTF